MLEFTESRSVSFLTRVKGGKPQRTHAAGKAEVREEDGVYMTEYKGSVYEHLEYTPYGELWIDHSAGVSTNPTVFRFTGKGA